jgi:cytochrome c biogenesis protein CcmG/thiol:disulfide interchange protein DsbE
MTMTTKKTTTNTNSTRLVVAAIVVAIASALIVAVVAGGGSSDDDVAPVTTSSTAVAPGAAAENQPVVVDGMALEPLIDETADPAVGLTPPTLSGASFDGSELSITPGQGGDVLLVFLAHWCPHCNAEIPVILDWQANGMIPEGLSIVGISTAVSADRPNFPPSDWIASKGWSWPVMADSVDQAAAAAYGVSGYPFMVIVGADGTVKGRTSGEKGLEFLDAWVRSTLG